MTKTEKAVVQAAERFFWAWRESTFGFRRPSRATWLASTATDGDATDKALIRAVRAHLQSKRKKGGK